MQGLAGKGDAIATGEDGLCGTLSTVAITLQELKLDWLKLLWPFRLNLLPCEMFRSLNEDFHSLELIWRHNPKPYCQID